MMTLKKLLAAFLAFLFGAPAPVLAKENSSSIDNRRYGTPGSVNPPNAKEPMLQIPIKLTPAQKEKIEKPGEIALDAIDNPQRYRIYRANAPLFSERYGIPSSEVLTLFQSPEFKVMDALANDDVRYYLKNNDLHGFARKLRDLNVVPITKDAAIQSNNNDDSDDPIVATVTAVAAVQVAVAIGVAAAVVVYTVTVAKTKASVSGYSAPNIHAPDLEETYGPALIVARELGGEKLAQQLFIFLQTANPLGPQ